MNYKKTIKCIIVLILLCGCKDNEKNNIEDSMLIDENCVTINIDVPSPDILWNVGFSLTVDIAPYIDTLKIVKLELSDESMIGTIDKLEIYDDKIFILDWKTLSLFVFDISGKYLFKINAVGQGPEEYAQLEFFGIDRENNQIVLADCWEYFVMRYDMNGKFISRHKIPFWIEGITPIKGGYSLYSNFRNNRDKFDQEYNISILDSSMNVIKGYFPYNSEIYENPRISFGSGDYYYYKDSCRFYSDCLNATYDVNSKGVSSKYKFVFGKYNFDYSKVFDKDGVKEYLSNKKYYQLGLCNENDYTINFDFHHSSFLFVGFYSKASGKVLSSYPGFKMGEDYSFVGKPDASYNSWIISEIRIESLIGWKENPDDNDNADNIWAKEKKKIADEITSDDNSALLFYKLKPF